MENNKNKMTKTYLKWLCKRLILLVFDVLAVFCSFYLALVMRFYVDGGFAFEASSYLKAFYAIIPYYISFTILVFALTGLYSGRWRFAGAYDAYRILIANLITFAVLFGGTYLFYVRMPLTYYFIGTAIQACYLALSRFFIRIYDSTKEYIVGKKSDGPNALIVGIGDTAYYARRILENPNNESAHLKCIIAADSALPNTMMNGVPVWSNVGDLENAIKKYKIDIVCLADPDLKPDVIEKIIALCGLTNTEFRDYSGLLRTDMYYLSFDKMARFTNGPVRVVCNGKANDYKSASEALKAIPGLSKIISVSSENGITVFEIDSNKQLANNADNEWIKKTEEETGTSISYF